MTAARLQVPANHAQRAALEQAALTCPVFRSLHPDVEKPINFIWEAKPEA